MPIAARLVSVVCFALSGSVLAAESLPPLRVDPALLGPAAKRPWRAPEAMPPPPQPSPVQEEAGPGAAAPPAKAAPAAAPSGPGAQREPAALPPALGEPPGVEERAPLPPLYSAHAQAGVLPEPALKPARGLVPLPPEGATPYPVFVAGSRISGQTGVEVVVEGDAELRKANTSMSADRITYQQIEDEVEAVGNVRLRNDADIMSGPRLRFNLAESTGFFEQPRYSITRAPSSPATPQPLAIIAGEVVEAPLGLTTATGAAERLEFHGKNRVRLTDASYSTCTADDPDWYARVEELNLDYDREVGEGAGYTGQTRVEWLPEDNVLKRRRHAFAILHSHNLGGGFAGALNLNGVSDDAYFADLSSRIATTSQTNLLRQGILSYGAGWWSAIANVQKYQTLQDPALPAVAKPYERVPQVTLTARRPDIFGTDLALAGEFVNFDHPSNVVGRRTILYPQVSLPLQTPAWYVTPKAGYHLTRYDLSRQTAGVPERINRGLPILSVDSGLTFERDLAWQGRGLVQTLEPRLFYLYTPSRSQDQIPNFDSGAVDFNFATIFSEQVFAGGDRIGDANQLTAALTSRFVDPQSGQEFVRAMVGQRYYFDEQSVTVPGVPARPGGASDFLAALSGRVLERTYLDAAWQYNPRDRQTERFALGGRWQPAFAKVLNASYRFIRDPVNQPTVPGIRQIDVSGQWPLARGWYGVGRYNYSLREKRIVESVGGLEYDGGCWVARFVVQRFATATGTENTAFFVQLELNGFSRVGSDPLEILKRNIPGYGQINQPTADPAFGAY
jgi:lipopolysaccharide assembly outer membrane protein LptD (OstA)